MTASFSQIISYAPLHSVLALLATGHSPLSMRADTKSLLVYISFGINGILEEYEVSRACLFKVLLTVICVQMTPKSRYIFSLPSSKSFFAAVFTYTSH